MVEEALNSEDQDADSAGIANDSTNNEDDALNISEASVNTEGLSLDEDTSNSHPLAEFDADLSDDNQLDEKGSSAGQETMIITEEMDLEIAGQAPVKSTINEEADLSTAASDDISGNQQDTLAGSDEDEDFEWEGAMAALAALKVADDEGTTEIVSAPVQTDEDRDDGSTPEPEKSLEADSVEEVDESISMDTDSPVEASDSVSIPLDEDASPIEEEDIQPVDEEVSPVEETPVEEKQDAAEDKSGFAKAIADITTGQWVVLALLFVLDLTALVFSVLLWTNQIVI